MFDWLEDALGTVWGETKGVFKDVLDYQKTLLDHRLSSGGYGGNPIGQDVGQAAPAQGSNDGTGVQNYQGIMLALSVAGVGIALIALLMDD